jgi:hypothetical protein
MKKNCFVFGIILLISCSAKKDFSKNFSFRIKVSYESAYDSYDLQKEEYERNYTNSVAKIKVEFSEKERISILNAFKEVNFLSFPDKFESVPNSKGEIDLSNFPGSTIEISFTENGKTKTVYYNSSDTSQEFKQRTQKFIDFENKIWKLIENKAEVRNLKKSDWEFY